MGSSWSRASKVADPRGKTLPDGLTPEEQLCLLLSRANFAPTVSARALELTASGLRWDVLVERAAFHGLLPLIYQRLRRLNFPGIPDAVRRQLKDSFGVNALRNELLAQELVRVLERLAGAGVPLMPLKGVALAEAVYGDAALRICADLDVLIRPEHLAKALPILRSLGYSDRLREPSFVRLLARYGKDCALMRQHGRSAYPLQVHCGLIWGGPPERRVLAEVWSSAVAKPFHDAPACVMSPEWEFLYLAVHAARHGRYPFKWLVDLDWISARGALDWTLGHEKAMRWGWGKAVQSCLAACAGLLETPIPEPFAREVQPLRMNAQIAAPGSLAIPRETLFAVRLLPTLRQRLQFLVLRLFVPTPADGELLHLPSSLFFLYYGLRPLRLIVTVGRWLIQAGMARLRRLLRA